MSAPVEAYHHPTAGRDDWETPPSLFAEWDARFGFTLDVCALPRNAKCPRFYTPEVDGLTQDWGTETAWMNPPYGRAIRAWIRKAHESAQRGATVVALVPSRTDSAWWHDHVEQGEVTFLRGRVKFVGAEHNAPFPCAIVVWRPQAVATASCADSRRWAALCALVAEKPGTAHILAQSPANEHDEPWASIQRVDQWQNPHATTLFEERATLTECIDTALAASRLP